eukprot:TRINITY_DN4652_c0_g1_i1.p1 TRINITY_DN4652_c0_g1~~TRINITY_DN4652_c0_g1_i1.p1  ORF type:complete len:758 (-),score=294.39 TRINITY_DN4652_c0_g1_i1:255-2528(-)
MPGKRRASQAFQPTKISEDEFTSGDKFVFTIDSPSPKGRVTRSRRSSICLNPPTKPATKARRQTMLPAVKEMPKSPVKTGKLKVVEQLLKTPSKAIGDFYASPAKAKAPINAVVNKMSPIKSVSAASSVSPTKKFSKSGNKTLTEMEILENLDFDDEFDNKTPVDAKKPPKTFQTEIPAEKTKNQRKTVDIKSPIVVANSKKSKIPVKSPPPVKAAKTTEEKVKKPTVKAGKITKSPPAKKATKSPATNKPVKSKPEIAKPEIKTPKKIGKVSLKNLPPGSPLLDSIFKDLKKVEIRLTPMKIKEDPNVIFDLLEEHQESKFRVQKVVEEIVKMKKDASPKTRLNISKDDSVVEVTPVEKVQKSTKKSSGKTKAAPKSAKKTEASPTLKPRGRKAAPKDIEPKVVVVPEKKVEPEVVVVPEKKVKESKKAPVKEAKATKDIAKTVEKESKKMKVALKVTKTVEKDAKKIKAAPKETKPSKTGVKRALEAKSTPVQNKRIKLEKKTPNAFEIHEPTKKDSKTPKTAKKQLKTPKAAIKVEPITPVTPVVEPKSVSKAPLSVKKSATKKTPKLMSQYKQKTPLGSLKKPLKRLSVAKSTPAQVKPSDLLKKNLRKQVETAITAKMGSKPDSSPYTISAEANTENSSPVFTKVETVTSKVVKSHITGTPARTKPTRKFGTVIQPTSLLEDSVMPTSAMDHKTVSSSTPLKAAMTGSESNCEPHPLESVEATPIRAPGISEPKSPQPMMVTGGLAKMCSIM